jgi:hypothetical protein
MKKLFIFLSVFIIFLFGLKTNSWAITYDLVAPSGLLKRGQDTAFTININTEGTSVTSTQIGLTYEIAYLKYIGTAAGASMTGGVSVEDLGDGRLLLTGSNAAGFSGTGAFAVITFNLIAESPGSTQLCALWAPTPAPTSRPAPTSTPRPTALPLQPTATPPPTGSVNNTLLGFTLGIVLIAGAIGIKYQIRPTAKSTKNSHKNKH